MPIFEFLCKECRREFKTLRAADKLHTVACPDCGTPKVSRLLSVTARSASEGTAGEMCASIPQGGGCCGMNPMGCGCRN